MCVCVRVQYVLSVGGIRRNESVLASETHFGTCFLLHLQEERELIASKGGLGE